jgi:hypothetical protein
MLVPSGTRLIMPLQEAVGMLPLLHPYEFSASSQILSIPAHCLFRPQNTSSYISNRLIDSTSVSNFFVFTKRGYWWCGSDAS